MSQPDLKASLDEGVTPDDVLTDEAATLLAAKLKTPLQIGQHLVRAFEAGFEIGAKPIDTGVVEAVLSSQLNDLEPQLKLHPWTKAIQCMLDWPLTAPVQQRGHADKRGRGGEYFVPMIRKEHRRSR